MAAIDSIGVANLTAGSTYGAAAPASGDSLQVRNFPAAGRARLLGVFYDSGAQTPQPGRIRSPLLHDNVQGIRFAPRETPSAPLVPPVPAQELYAQDELAVELSTAPTTGVAAAVLQIYYDQLPGASARLHAPGDIMGLVQAIKPVLVTFPSGANTAGQWADLLLIANENLLHANTDYAVLGITNDIGVAAVAIRGIDTANLRIAVPGVGRYEATADYFVDLSLMTGLPCIPVINSANAASTQVSIFSAAQIGAAASVIVYLAELSQPVS